jgi:broad specificity phosphatase PhoE
MSIGSGSRTVLYLVRHGATEANLAQPPRLQGRRHNPPLARIGVRQAEATRDFLADKPLDACFSSPLLRAVQTAAILSAPHGLSPQPLDALTECDLGRWEGLDWQTVRYLDAEGFHRFQQSPQHFGYPDGETLADLQARAIPALERLLADHPGKTLLVVGHHLVHRTLLARLLGMSPGQADLLSMDNCGISVVVCEFGKMTVCTLNAAFHLARLAA